jgi:hypothetical protein
MSKVSQDLRERLLRQRESLNTGGSRNNLLIDNKTITEKGIRIRMLPVIREGASLAEEFRSYYCRELNTGTTSPMCFGLPDPIEDALKSIYLSGSNAKREHAKEFINQQREFWMPVVVRGDEGTVSSPNIRIFRCKASIYNSIVDWMMDDDLDDMTDPLDGRDLKVKKTGQGIETRWSVDRLDRSPLSEDKEMVEALMEAAAGFDVREHFYRYNLDTVESIYEGLTGDVLPESHREALSGGGRSTRSEEEPQPSRKAAVSAELDALLTDDEDESSDDNLFAAGDRVQFTDDDGDVIFGSVLGVDDEEPSNLLVVDEGGDPDEPWSIPVSDLDPAPAKKKSKVKKTTASARIREAMED